MPCVNALAATAIMPARRARSMPSCAASAPRPPPERRAMKIVIFGLAITSSWGNGHATTYRALVRALHARGHRVDFFERDLEWYRDNRDLPAPDFCRLHIYDEWRQALPEARQLLRDADLAIVGSYAPDALAATREVFDSPAAVKAFYDIDTPITVAALRAGGATEYLTRDPIGRAH